MFGGARVRADEPASSSLTHSRRGAQIEASCADDERSRPLDDGQVNPNGKDFFSQHTRVADRRRRRSSIAAVFGARIAQQLRPWRATLRNGIQLGIDARLVCDADRRFPAVA